MISHHPDTNLLVEFANGSCDWALGILINTHLEHCRHCRSQIQQLEQVGAALLTAGPLVSVEDACLEKLWRRIDEAPAKPQRTGARAGKRRFTRAGTAFTAQWPLAKISKHLKQLRLKPAKINMKWPCNQLKAAAKSAATTIAAWNIPWYYRAVFPMRTASIAPGILFCANPAKPTNPPPAKMKIACV